jgi:hypothetical protein
MLGRTDSTNWPQIPDRPSTALLFDTPFLPSSMRYVGERDASHRESSRYYGRAEEVGAYRIRLFVNK